MSAAVVLLFVIILMICIRLLNLTSQAVPPFLHFTSSEYIKAVLDLCPLLSQEYIPTGIWGKSGHLQTILYGKMGRINSPFPRGERHSVIMPDAATMTFDVFQPQAPHPSDGDITMCVCPGIANSSESLYIRTFVHYAQTRGYRLAVLNHLGAPKNVPLTAPRVFTYGGTDEFAEMINKVQEIYPETTILAVGFSMGGNIVTKYLGESHENQAKVLCGISCCQGYDAERAMSYYTSWEHFRKCYFWAMTQHMKSLLRRHFNVLFSGDTPYDTKQIFSSSFLLGIDEFYSRRQLGFNNVYEYYRDASCVHVIDNIEIPMFFLNALDDPLVPEPLLEIPRKLASHRHNVLAATTRHGGHLGYFEGGTLIPDTITWLDKVVVEYADAAIHISNMEDFGNEVCGPKAKIGEWENKTSGFAFETRMWKKGSAPGDNGATNKQTEENATPKVHGYFQDLPDNCFSVAHSM